MFDPNVDRVMAAIEPHHVVLDIGGWARPFNRANWVMDAAPYDTRGYYGASRPAQGGDREHFTRDTWIVRDICDHAPYPFADKQFDYVICSHVLEDVRDPLWVCQEMRRIARRGYIEMPSREVESSRGTEPNQVGWSHHRWLATIVGNRITFLMKYHRIHAHWRLSFPASHLRTLSEERTVQWLFWEDWFDVEEQTIHGVDEIEMELADYVRRVRPYNQVVVDMDRAARRLANQIGRVRRWAGRQWPSGSRETCRK
jgi:SAM-dependent methyltransferase